MTKIKVTKTIDGKAYSYECDYDFGGTSDGMLQLFGIDIVYRHALQAMTIALQARLRANITDKKAMDETVKSWKPGQQRVRKTKLEKASTLIGDMSADERAELLKALKAS